MICCYHGVLVKALDSTPQRAIFHRSESSELLQCHRASCCLNEDVSPAIVSLLSLRCPPAIPRFVVAIVVDAIERVRRRWPRSHISQESREVITPRFADRDPAPTVQGVFRIAPRITAALGVAPAFVFRRMAAIAAGPVRQRTITGLFRSETPTTLCPSISQGFTLDRGQGTAIAATLPEHARTRFESIWSTSQHDQTTKAPARHVDQAWTATPFARHKTLYPKMAY